jgi:hypothetical protein
MCGRCGFCLSRPAPIEEISARKMSFVYDGGPEVVDANLDLAAAAMPGTDTADLIAAEFKKSAALFTVSTQHTLIVAQPNFKFVGFARLISRLIAIDEADGRERILVWILDLGHRNIQDLGSRVRFENVDELVRRFKALRFFDDRGAQARWDWLKSRAVVVLRDPESRGNDEALPDFAAQRLLLDAIPLAWTGAPNFRALYGRDFEHLNEAIYTIFLHGSAERGGPDSSSDANRGGGACKIRCYAHAKFTAAGGGDRQARGMGLPGPGDEYEAAFRAVYAAATDFLGLRRSVDHAIDAKKAAQDLRSLGFLLLRLDEFVNLHPRA